MLTTRSRALLALTAVAALGAAPLAQAGDNVFWSIGVAPAPGVYVGASNAQPAVVVSPPRYVVPTPQPVYVVPRPVLVQPAPVMVTPAPVYVVRPAPAFVPPGHQWHGHRGWGHGHGHGRGHGHGEGHGEGQAWGEPDGARWQGGWGRRG